ncbi:hypothetical protein EV702DRAFT_1240575 [Suillus placidus]|uniref:Uncharacterized protein n=1 Tax=Suillus placidus TaxID=48579 RepID=A0A9P6ZQ56_9AGAM|nr:hypothetical protein EV702DRAFT_1240575 [Suillus placidus]
MYLDEGWSRLSTFQERPMQKKDWMKFLACNVMVGEVLPGLFKASPWYQGKYCLVVGRPLSKCAGIILQSLNRAALLIAVPEEVFSVQHQTISPHAACRRIYVHAGSVWDGHDDILARYVESGTVLEKAPFTGDKWNFVIRGNSLSFHHSQYLRHHLAGLTLSHSVEPACTPSTTSSKARDDGYECVSPSSASSLAPVGASAKLIATQLTAIPFSTSMSLLIEQLFRQRYELHYGYRVNRSHMFYLESYRHGVSPAAPRTTHVLVSSESAQFLYPHRNCHKQYYGFWISREWMIDLVKNGHYPEDCVEPPRDCDVWLR